MKKLAIAIGLTVLGMSPSFAADMPVKALVAQPVQVYDWSGIYAGANLGWSRATFDWDYYNLPGQSIHRRPDTFQYGGHVGAQYQWNQFVIGVEAQWSPQKMDSYGPDAPIFAAAFDAETTLKQVVTVGPRIGWVFSPQWMVYATGGYAQGAVHTGFFARGFPNVQAGIDKRPDGWFAGGGLDYLFTNWLYMGVEYRHIDFGTELHSSTVIPATGAARYVSTTADMVQVRLGVKFNGFERAR